MYDYVDYYSEFKDIVNKINEACTQIEVHRMEKNVGNEISEFSVQIESLNGDITELWGDNNGKDINASLEKIISELCKIKESIDNDYINAEEVYLRIRDNLKELKKLDSDLKRESYLKPKRHSEKYNVNSFGYVDQSIGKDSWLNDLKKWEQNFFLLRQDCNYYRNYINEDLIYLEKINGVNISDGKSNLSMYVPLTIVEGKYARFTNYDNEFSGGNLQHVYVDSKGQEYVIVEGFGRIEYYGEAENGKPIFGFHRDGWNTQAYIYETIDGPVLDIGGGSVSNSISYYLGYKLYSCLYNYESKTGEYVVDDLKNHVGVYFDPKRDDSGRIVGQIRYSDKTKQIITEEITREFDDFGEPISCTITNLNEKGNITSEVEEIFTYWEDGSDRRHLNPVHRIYYGEGGKDVGIITDEFLMEDGKYVHYGEGGKDGGIVINVDSNPDNFGESIAKDYTFFYVFQDN